MTSNITAGDALVFMTIGAFVSSLTTAWVSNKLEARREKKERARIDAEQVAIGNDRLLSELVESLTNHKGDWDTSGEHTVTHVPSGLCLWTSNGERNLRVYERNSDEKRQFKLDLTELRRKTLWPLIEKMIEHRKVIPTILDDVKAADALKTANDCGRKE